jgi:glutathione-regulated potassium-efflux system ancillary protein KefC/glutathione-regulated potassium-efflux system protein KefB
VPALTQAALLLGGAIAAVLLFKQLKLGAILGYLVAGVALGPSGFGVVTQVEEMLHVSELGVVFFLFLVGLELEPKRLWELRRSVFGLGNGQLLATGAILMCVGFAAGLPFGAAVVIALGLSLSSTAIALKLLAERGQMAAPAGRGGFAMLLFQDLAVVPILAIIPLLSGKGAGTFADTAIASVKVIGMVVAIVVGGRFLMRPLFATIAKAHVHEISTAVALLVVVGAGVLMSAVGMSMALGAFLAGVLLADSEYRHELEASIDPFKGLLLGLFFMAIGMNANVRLVVDQPLLVFGCVLGLLTVKASVLYGIGKLMKLERRARVILALALAEGGEFAFVLFGVAGGAGVLTRDQAELMVVVVSMSMASAPLLLVVLDPLIEKLAPKKEQREFDIVDESNPVIIAGFGRYGQIIARVLMVSRIKFTALEVSPDQVDFVRKFGNKIHYGDASRLDLLRAAKTESARAFVLAIDYVEASMRTARVVKKSFPHVPIYARARNRNHAYELMDIGVHVMNRETFFSSLLMAEEVLVGLGMPRDMAHDRCEAFREYDERALVEAHAVHHDEAKVIARGRQSMAELQQLMDIDDKEKSTIS